MHVDYDGDAWFAGFTDGEGSFVLARKYGRGGKLLGDGDRFCPVFSIGLRADDVGVLRSLQACFGGYVKVRDSGQSQRPGSRPRAEWVVGAKADLARLVDYFERFPLRAKKAADCAVWCEAVRIYVGGTCSDPRLALLQAALNEGREYVEPTPLRIVEAA